MKRVIGIGNALTDILINIPSDNILEHFGFAGGSMSLVDTETQRRISEKTADVPRALSLGGSAGNTIRAMAKMGVQTGFIGKVGWDDTGDFLIRALENLGVEPVILRGESPSGHCISLISPNGERTMATYLGAALELSPAEIAREAFDGYDYFYMEGYLVQDHDLVRRAVALARDAGLKIAADLASFNVVDDNLEFLRWLVSEYVDIVFANEQEARSFTEKDDPREALDIIAEMCSTAVVKIGTKGAYIKHGGETVHVGIMAAAKRVDTTGAGDFYAAGFMYGLCNGLSLRQCGTIGAIAAGKVIEVFGTTFADEVWHEVLLHIESVKTEKLLF